MTREELIEVMARAIDRLEYLALARAQNATDRNDAKSAGADGRAAIAALEAAGVRLVYVGEAKAQLIDGDERTTVRIFTPYASE